MNQFDAIVAMVSAGVGLVLNLKFSNPNKQEFNDSQKSGSSGGALTAEVSQESRSERLQRRYHHPEVSSFFVNVSRFSLDLVATF